MPLRFSPRRAWRSVASPEVTLALLIFLTVMSVARSPLRGVGVSISDAAQPLRVVVLLAFGAWALESMRGDPADRVRLVAPALPLAATTVISLLLSPFPLPEAAEVVPMLLLVCGAPLVAAACMASETHMRRTIRACALAMGAVVIVNLLLVPAVAQSPLRADRFQGILENPNAVGALGFMAVPLFVAAARISSPGSRERKAWIGILLLGLAELGLSGSRAGIAGALVAGATISLLWPGSMNARSRIVAVLVMVLGASLVVVFSPARELFRLDQLSEAGGRSNAWPLAVSMIEDRPGWGYGYGSSVGIFEDFGKIPGFQGGYPGNVFLDLGLEVGFAGILAFAVLLLFAIARGGVALTKAERLEPRAVAALGLAIVAGGLANAQAESFLVRPGGVGAPLFWSALGWLLVAGAMAIEAAGSRAPLWRRSFRRNRVQVALAAAAVSLGACVAVGQVLPTRDRVEAQGVASAVSAATGLTLEQAEPAVSTETVGDIRSAWWGGTPAESVLVLVCRDAKATKTVTGGSIAPPDRSSRVIRAGNVVVIYSGSGSTTTARAIRRALETENIVQ